MDEDLATATAPAPESAPKPPLLRRMWAALGNAWEAARKKLYELPATGNPKVIKVLALAGLVGVLALGFLMRTPGPARPTTPAAEAPTADVQPGLQDQINALRLRVIVLEARADAAPPTGQARAIKPRASAARPAALADMAATDSPPPAPKSTWGITDLDREIAAFPSTSLEQSK